MEGGEARGPREVGEPRTTRVRMKGKAKVMVTARRGQVRRPSWLPDGWIVEVGVGEDGGEVKYYTSPVSQKTFSSKAEVLHYLRVAKFDDHVSDTSFSEHNKADVVGQGRNSPNWLPRGWILEIRTLLSGAQAGKTYKSYFDPFSGSRFYSKSEVLRFLKSGNLHTPTSGEKQRFKANATDNVLAQIEYSPVGLPQGWIKETKFRKSNNSKGIRRDPYYTDPVSGYVFRSLKDAVHYVETGERSAYAFGPRKCSINEMYSLEKESPLPVPFKESTSPGLTRRRLLTEEATTSNGEDIQQTKVMTDKKRKGKPEADGPVNSSKHGERKAKQVSPSKKWSKHEEESEGSKEFLEPEMAVEKSSVPPTEVTPVARERKQRSSKGNLASLPRRSSKRLAGLAAAPATDLVIRRPSCELQSNGRSNKIENSVRFTEPGRMEAVEAASAPEHSLSSRQPLSNGQCKGVEGSVPVKEPEREDTADEAYQGEQMLLTGQISEAKPPTRPPLSNGWCNGIEESAPLILVEPKRKDAASETSRGERVLLAGRASEDKPPSRTPPSEGASQREKALLTGQTSQDRPSSPLASTFDSCWDDPCIQFAVKTLTGEIPVLDVGMAIDEYVQQQLSSSEVLNPIPSASSVGSDLQNSHSKASRARGTASRVHG